MHRKALYELGKRPYDQRRSSAVLKGAMNLTRYLEIETRCWRRLFRDQKLLLRCSPRHRPIHNKNEGPSTYTSWILFNIIVQDSKAKYPSTSLPGVIYGDIPTPRSSQNAIRIRLPRHSTKEPADVLVLDCCVPGDGHVDAPNRIVRRRQA